MWGHIFSAKAKAKTKRNEICKCKTKNNKNNNKDDLNDCIWFIVHYASPTLECTGSQYTFQMRGMASWSTNIKNYCNQDRLVEFGNKQWLSCARKLQADLISTKNISLDLIWTRNFWHSTCKRDPFRLL